MTQPSPHDLFWLARYAHNAVAPLVTEDEKLIIHIQFEVYPGVDVWIHSKSGGGVRHHKLQMTTQKDVDRFVQTLRAKALAAA